MSWQIAERMRELWEDRPAIRLISVEDVRNYLSHIIYILIFDFLLNFLLFVRLQTPTSSTDQLWFFVT